MCGIFMSSESYLPNAVMHNHWLYIYIKCHRKMKVMQKSMDSYVCGIFMSSESYLPNAVMHNHWLYIYIKCHRKMKVMQ